MISYAQNFEDIMLWRALKHIKSGFYVDVGAWSPDLDSVTRVFYENGWKGINIEPNPEFYQQYLEKRPKDTNINVAISNVVGEIDIYFSTNPGLSSLSKEIAEGHKNIGWEIHPSKTYVTTLSEILSEYGENKEIHFLKIDIEGYEKQALLGANWKDFRPWIVVVEATLPMSQIENYQEWEYILFEANYDFVYADGLNRFYIAQEHSELKEAFKYPPNVFDNYILYSEYVNNYKLIETKSLLEQTGIKLIETESILEQTGIKLIETESILEQTGIKLIETEQRLLNLEKNFLWRVTKPFRIIISILQKNFRKVK